MEESISVDMVRVERCCRTHGSTEKDFSQHVCAGVDTIVLEWLRLGWI